MREVSDLPWREIALEKRIWLLPAERAKNRRAHIINLSDLAVEIIEGLPRFADERDFVFSATGKRPVQAHSDAKAKIDRLLAASMPNMEPWVVHDIRRSVATGLAGLGIAPHVLDRVLNQSVVKSAASHAYTTDTNTRLSENRH